MSQVVERVCGSWVKTGCLSKGGGRLIQVSKGILNVADADQGETESEGDLGCCSSFIGMLGEGVINGKEQHAGKANDIQEKIAEYCASHPGRAPRLYRWPQFEIDACADHAEQARGQ